MRVQIISFGFLHGPTPEAHQVLDLRQHFKDPDLRPGLRYLTARDQEVRDAVTQTPGIVQLVAAYVAVAQAYAAGPSAETVPLRIAPGCAGGRHRAPVVAEMLQAALVDAGFEVEVQHRDLDKDVVESGREARRTDQYAEVIEQALDSLLEEMGDELDTTVMAENAAGALVAAGY
ncbi:ATPase [Kitasatospora sp. NPDC048194]|uniref:RapZ C-terminal domain-containing protein n=1 Tax=Kitasatospora sp. NPDC048194 TaxID=3364045 RepID=UPI0037136478